MRVGHCGARVHSGCRGAIHGGFRASRYRVSLPHVDAQPAPVISAWVVPRGPIPGTAFPYREDRWNVLPSLFTLHERASTCPVMTAQMAPSNTSPRAVWTKRTEERRGHRTPLRNAQARESRTSRTRNRRVVPCDTPRWLRFVRECSHRTERKYASARPCSLPDPLFIRCIYADIVCILRAA